MVDLEADVPAFKRANLMRVDGVPAVAGVFTQMPVPLDAVTICLGPGGRWCAAGCTCGFSGYRTRLDALRHRTPMAPVVSVLAGGQVRDPAKFSHLLYRRQRVVRVEFVAACFRCGVTAGVGLQLRPRHKTATGAVEPGKEVLMAVCAGHALIGVPVWSTVDAAGELGVPVGWLSDDLTRYLVARDAGERAGTGRRAWLAAGAWPDRQTRCWCDRTDVLTDAGHRTYFELGLFCSPGRPDYACAACETLWELDRDHGGAVKATVSA